MKRRKYPPGVRVLGASWWLDFTYGGVRIRRRVGPVDSLTVEDVEKVRALAIGDAVKAGEAIDPSRHRAVLLGDLKRRYSETLPAGRRRKKFDQYAKHLLSGFGAGTPVDQIGLGNLVSYRGRREAEKVLSKGTDRLTSPAEVTRELSAMRAAFSWAERFGVPLGHGNVFRKLGRADRKNIFPPEPPKPPVILTDEELAAVCENTTPPFARLFRFLAATGMRFGEATAITWDCVFTRDAVIPHVLLPKTKAGKPRTVPLSREALAILQECPRTSDRVFTGAEGAPIQNVGRAWISARVKAKVPTAKLHGLRHRFATEFIRRGGSVAALRDVCGWRDLTVPSRYTHSSPRDVLAVLNGPGSMHPGQTAVKAVAGESA